MNQVMRVVNTPENEVSEAHLAFCRHYQERTLVLDIVGQLNHLVRDVQRHRGMSMGVLAGSDAFEDEMVLLQGHIGRRLEMLQAFSSFSPGVLDERDRTNLQLAWNSIHVDWHDDKLSDNFELHSHFIEQLFFLVGKFTKVLTGPLGDEDLISRVGDQSERAEMLQYTCSLMPEVIEHLAKIRGLASFAAAIGTAQYEHDRKLRFLVQTVRKQNEVARQRSQRLNEVLNVTFQAKTVISEFETKFNHLMELVTHDVLSGQTIHASSSQLFNLATVLIDAYWRVVDEGLDIVRSWHGDDLRRWIEKPID